MMGEEMKALTVSREALRADLAEMELRLRIYFDDQLKHKADAATVVEMALTLDRLSRGEWSPAQRLSIEEIVEESLVKKTDRGWSARERWFGVLTIAVAVLTLLLSVLVATHRLS